MKDRRLNIASHFISVALLISASVWPQALHAASASTAQGTASVNPANLTTLKGSVVPWAKPENEIGVADGDLALKNLTLVLKRTTAQQAALDHFLAAQQDPSSSQYHKWLTPSEFGSEFGPSDTDIQKIVQWIESFGFKVGSLPAAHNLLTFSGTHAQLKSAFHTELHRYRVDGQEYLANSVDPKIPSEFASLVGGFVSLNNFPPKALHTEPQLVRKDASSGKWSRVQDASNPAPAFTITLGSGQTVYPITPYDFATIYNVKPLWDAGIDGTGETIAIVADSDINPSDIDSFRSMFGLPAKNLNVFYASANPGPTPDEGEADLDVEWSGAVAKNATVDLVVGNSADATNGVAEAIAYIINNNLAPIMSVSFGECEAELGTGGNLFFDEAWQQASAQGITVMVAAGDAGSATCDQESGSPVANYGLTVSGFASTPYNVSVGGTDFYPTFATPSQYWSSTNDPQTLASALSYIPESIWNDSCANPHVLGVLQSEGLTDTSEEALCNDASEQPYFLDPIGGAGGASSCTNSDGIDITSCSGGYPKPDWQTGIPGIPQDGVRDLPDVSLMAGNGLWGTFYLYCESDTSPGAVCDVNTFIQGAGGTSFASPSFAGIMALVQQKTQSQQGNVNYVLYKLAAEQYSNPTLQNACVSANITGSNACMFYDVADGTNSLPCGTGSPNCDTSNPADQIGLLSGYAATTGFDLASGLGSINAYNLVENWSGAASTALPTSVTLNATSAVSITYGTSVDLSVAVAAKQLGSGTPGGDVAILSDSSVLNGKSIADGTLASGQTAMVASELPVGTYNLYARYAGNADYAPSTSTGISVTVTAAIPAVAITASKTTLAGNPNTSTLRVTVTGNPYGFSPTGTVTFTDTTTGTQIGLASLQQSVTLATASNATLNVTVAQLAGGANTISASYSGDSDYSAGSVPTVVIRTTPAFTVAINPSNMTISSTSNGGTATVTVTPVSGAAIPASLNFACPSTLPAGLACSFGPVTASNGVFTSQLTIQLASPLASGQPTASTAERASLRIPFVVASALFLFGLRRRRRMFVTLALLFTACLPLAILGCGGSGKSSTPPPNPTPASTTTTLSVSSSAPALNSSVTFTAAVAPVSGTGTPSGSVSFMDGTTNIGTATLSNGSAGLTISSLAIGKHVITGNYQGTTGYTSSTSAASTVDVTFITQLTVGATDSLGNNAVAPLAITVD